MTDLLLIIVPLALLGCGVCFFLTRRSSRQFSSLAARDKSARAEIYDRIINPKP